MKTQLGTVLGLLALAVAGVAVSKVQARQVQPTRTEEERPKFDLSRLNRWIPPADRFLVHGYQADSKDGWEEVLTTVPYGRWLILTDISVGPTTSAALVSVEGKERRPLLDTVPYRDHKGPWTDMQSEFATYHSSIGLVLPPAAKLLVRNGGVGNADVAWHLTGYYYDVE